MPQLHANQPHIDEALVRDLIASGGTTTEIFHLGEEKQFTSGAVVFNLFGCGSDF